MKELTQGILIKIKQTERKKMSTMMWVAVCIFAIGFVIIAVLGILGTNDVINYHNEQYRKEREQK